MEQFYKRLSNLFSVKSIVTVLLTVAFIFLAIEGRLNQDYMTIYTVVIAFYFGTQIRYNKFRKLRNRKKGHGLQISDRMKVTTQPF